MSGILLVDEVERVPGLGCMSPASNNRTESQVIGNHGKYIKCYFVRKQLICKKYLSFYYAFTRMPEYNVFCQI